MQVNGFEFYKLDYAKRKLDSIPEEYGIYQWIYWPKFDENKISTSELIEILRAYSANNFYLEEELKGTYKFHAKIWEQGYKENSNPFGLSNKKIIELNTFLEDRDNILFFNTFFKEVCFSRPFYLGKANNLKTRIGQHIDGRTNVIKEITLKNIPEKDIWIGFKIIPSPKNTTSINTIFEEIYTRAVKPGLTIKPN